MPPYEPPAAPTFTAPTVDSSLSSRMRPTTQIQESSLLKRAASVGQKYQPQRTAQIGQTRASLKRFGGYNVGDDGSISEKKGPQPGQAYREAYGAERDAANARGMMDSSLAAKAIGAAWGRLSAEAQSIVTQHAMSFNQIAAAEAADYDEISQTLLSLYGDEAQYMLDHPPPPPEPKVDPGPSPITSPHPNQAPAGVSQSAMSPGFRVNNAGNVVTSYTKADLTPANRKKLQAQFPGYQIVISGTGAVVMKKVS